jgi:hypothetical protein
MKSAEIFTDARHNVNEWKLQAAAAAAALG